MVLTRGGVAPVSPAPHSLRGPLAGLRVVDVATLFAGPFAARLLGDYGADVIKVEHPDGDPLRAIGPDEQVAASLAAADPVAHQQVRTVAGHTLLDLDQPGAARPDRRGAR
ncbi:hypothetical protein FAIPA1_20207 [Frankia sp. AiPs1]